jgi:histidine triad (HIT) family protein
VQEHRQAPTALGDNQALRLQGLPGFALKPRPFYARCQRRSAQARSSRLSRPEDFMAYDDNNIFAKLLRGEIPSIKLCENDAAVAIMDVMPQSEGHVLVLPKEGAEEIYELSPEAVSAAMAMVQKMAVALRSALKPDGLTIAQFNGAAAGQTVPHVHFHLIPRRKGEELRMHARDMADKAELEAVAQRIRAAL